MYDQIHFCREDLSVMKERRFFKTWLVVILMMAVGIGIVGAMTIRNEKEKEATNAHPSSYLTNQRKHDIDLEELAQMTGSYKADDWQLSISEEAKEKGPYLAVSDSSGNPAFEGPIMFMKKNIIIVELDHDLYKALPDGWEPDSSGDYVVMDYNLTDNGIELGYKGKTLVFKVQQP